MVETTMTTQRGESDTFEFDIISQMDRSTISDIFKPLDALDPNAFGNNSEAAAAAALVDGGSPGPSQVVAVAAVVPQPEGSKRAVPSTPLKKAQVLLKQVHKLSCEINSLVLRMQSMKYQNELMVRLRTLIEQLQQVFNAVSELVKKGADTDEDYSEHLKAFLDMKTVSLADRQEAEAVTSHTGRPLRKRAEPGVAGAKKPCKKKKLAAPSIVTKGEPT
jgi:hypothetical protein